MDDNIFQSQPGPFAPIGPDESSTLRRTAPIQSNIKCEIPKQFDQSIDKYYYLNSLEGFADPSSPSIVISDTNIVTPNVIESPQPQSQPQPQLPQPQPPQPQPQPQQPQQPQPQPPQPPQLQPLILPSAPKIANAPKPQNKPKSKPKKTKKQVQLKGSGNHNHNNDSDDDSYDDDYYQYYDVDHNYFYPNYIPAWGNPYFTGPPPPIPMTIPLPVSTTPDIVSSPGEINTESVEQQMISFDILILIAMFVFIFIGIVIVFKK